MAITSKQFIKNLKQFKKDPMSIMKDDIINIIYLILHQMAEYTVDDSGRARSLIIKKFADKYKIDVSDLDRGYDFWKDNGYPENSERDFDGKGSTLTDDWGKNNYRMSLDMDDVALTLQETSDDFEPSIYHSLNTGRDNSKFKPRMIRFVADHVDAGSFSSVEGLEKAIDDLIKNIGNYLLGGS